MQGRWQSWLTAVVGLWLIASPWVLDYHGDRPAAWNAYIFGFLLVVVAVAAASLREAAAGGQWITVLIGIWLLCAPWVLGFASPGVALGGADTALAGWSLAAWNAGLTGLLVVALAGWALAAGRSHAAGPA